MSICLVLSSCLPVQCKYACPSTVSSCLPVHVPSCPAAFLSMCLPFQLLSCPYTCLFSCLPVRVHSCPVACLPVHIPVYQAACLSMCLPAQLPTCPSSMRPFLVSVSEIRAFIRFTRIYLIFYAVANLQSSVSAWVQKGHLNVQINSFLSVLAISCAKPQTSKSFKNVRRCNFHELKIHLHSPKIILIGYRHWYPVCFRHEKSS